jgi:hypothetical protein
VRGWGGQYFGRRQTFGLASYSIIPPRILLSKPTMRVSQIIPYESVNGDKNIIRIHKWFNLNFLNLKINCLLEINEQSTIQSLTLNP